MSDYDDGYMDGVDSVRGEIQSLQADLEQMRGERDEALAQSEHRRNIIREYKPLTRKLEAQVSALRSALGIARKYLTTELNYWEETREQAESNGPYPTHRDIDESITHLQEAIKEIAQAALNTVTSGDMVLVPREVINFLKGAGPLEGVWFGEKHPDRRGNFWWRKFLPNVQGNT